MKKGEKVGRAEDFIKKWQKPGTVLDIIEYIKLKWVEPACLTD